MEESGSARRTATDMPAIPFVSGEGESKRNGTAASPWEDAGGGPASSNRISDNTEMIIFIMFSQKAIESTTSLNPSLVIHPTVGIPCTCTRDFWQVTRRAGAADKERAGV